MDRVTETEVVKLDVPARHKYLNILGACLSALLERVEGLRDRDTLIYNVELAVHETCSNIVEHAYAGASGRIAVDITLKQDPRQLVVDVRDTGRPFDLSQVKEPAFEQTQTRGYGLFLIRSLVDEVTYRPQAGDNHWRLVKNI